MADKTRQQVKNVALVLAMLASMALPASAAPPKDALQRRIVAELRVFTNWLKKYNVQGYIGEVGWPDNYRGDAAKWNEAANSWFDVADAAGLWVTVWATGQYWGTTYPQAVYENRDAFAGVESANTQAAVLAAHPSTSAYRRGIGVAGAEFNAPETQPVSSFSNANPGKVGTDYFYEPAATFTYLKSQGIDIVRIPFRWERIQRKLGGSLDGGELSRLKGTINAANAAGLKVILDVHNFGGYYLYDGTQGVRRALGTPQLTNSHFGDLWARLSAEFKFDNGVVGYALINEPVAMASSAAWEQASNVAIASIRANGDSKLILVPGYFYSGAPRWTQNHPVPWVSDPANNYRYEAHHYFDSNYSSAYKLRYAEENAAASALYPAP